MNMGKCACMKQIHSFLHNRIKVNCPRPLRFSSTSSSSAIGQDEDWAPEEKKPTSLQKATEHYDDFYSTVYGKRWPSIRLGLLTEAKYAAIPNTFLTDVDSVQLKLEKLGAFDMKTIWDQGREKIRADRKEFSTKKNLERMKELDRKLESIAHTRAAEEMDVLYQNAPVRKLALHGHHSSATDETQDDRRILSDVKEASQEYVSATKLKGLEEFELESEYFSSYSSTGDALASDTSNYNFTTARNCSRIEFPPFIRPMIFEPGSPSSFPSAAKESQTELRNYLCVNGASIAPVIALDLKPNVNLLDLCAGPGTKSLLALMTMCPATLTCNDLESTRLSRIYRLFSEFIGISKPENVIFTKINGTNYPDTTKYERVLADVPCLMDRVSLTVSENSIFKSTRIKERLGLVKLQKKILLSALQCLTPENDSACVYSTCTLSPIENDGVVGTALRESDVPNLFVDLRGAWDALLPFRLAGVYNLTKTKFGILIQPNVVSNVGPMYVSRIVVRSSNTELP